MNRSDSYLVTRPEQLDALASPIRLAILEVVSRAGRLTAAEIAHQIGRRPTSIYRHLHQLLGVGLLIDDEQRPIGRTRETVYRAIARYVYYEYDADDEARVEAICRATAMQMRMAARAAERALRAGTVTTGGTTDVTTHGPARNTHVGSAFAWLTEVELAELNRHIDAIWTLTHKSTRRRQTRFVGVTIALYPPPTSDEFTTR